MLQGDNLGDGKLLVYFDPKDDVPVLYEISKNSKGGCEDRRQDLCEAEFR